MRIISWSGAVICLGASALFVCLSASRAESQDPALKSTFGSVTLHAGFVPNPFEKELIAGGPVRTSKGGVNAWVANAPDFQLYYTAGTNPLTICARSGSETTLLINLPDGTWIADGLANSKLKIDKPQSGRYDIWVGTVGKGAPDATLYITELR